MNGPERLRKTLFELSFAGFGGDGPGGAQFDVEVAREFKPHILFAGALATFKLLRHTMGYVPLQEGLQSQKVVSGQAVAKITRN